MKWLLLVLIGLFSACNSSQRILGELEIREDSDWDSKVYLLDTKSLDALAASYLSEVIDSSLITEDGTFEFKNLEMVENPCLYLIAIQKKGIKYKNQLENNDPLKSNYIPVIYDGISPIHLIAQADSLFSTFRFIDPSPSNSELEKLRDIRIQAYHEYINEIRSLENEETTILDEEIAKIHFQESMMKFAEDTNNVLAGMLAYRLVSPENDYERVPEFVWNQCSKWRSSQPENQFVTQLCKIANSRKLPLMIGGEVPDFRLPMMNSDTFNLRDILADKLTLIDFWGSWCAPCRYENRNVLVPLWEETHNMGFGIIAYALDSSKSNWTKSIQKDGADRWYQASHLKGDEAPLMNACKITTIPANYLVDNQGKIIAKNLHGIELQEFVRDYLKNGQ
ncbi:MAG: TlpA family protein disulfide reductase [Saprospiraceae bacterium]|nr:TlpA family protein disulfide reductase [Saprospiraceae bacterium]